AYWGPQASGTSGPVYFGCLVIALCIAGLFLVRNWHLSWLLSASLLGLLLAWGSHLSSVNYFLFDHLPFYNKFRAPAMSLIIPQFTFCTLAAIGLQQILYSNIPVKELFHKLKPAVYTTGALALLLTAFYFTSDFSGPTDQERKNIMTNAFTQILGQQVQGSNTAATISSDIFSGLKEDRKSLFGKDLLRFWIFLILGIGLLYLAIQSKIKALYAGILATLLVFIDLINVDLRYLDQKNYIAEEEFLAPLEATAADLEIKKDTGYYRVFDQSSGDPFNDSRGAYHHNLINGYHPAKLGLYQDLIEYQISKNNITVLNMLNTKYVIGKDPQTQQPVVYPNPEALGPCWLVKNIRYVKTPDEEMAALNNIKPLDTVYIRETEKTKIKELPQTDSLASLQFQYNKNDSIRYLSNSTAPQFAVFSE
ncbi:MAG: hypothetical protein ACKO6K_09305, partial [Chitinophagaceae bacterium]